MKKFIILLFAVACIASCGKDEKQTKIDARVETRSATGITDTRATCWGIITEKGTGDIREYGIEIDRRGGSERIPYTTSKADSFGVQLDGLDRGRQYTYRAYAVENNDAARYGEYKTFTALVPADLLILFSDIAAESAVVEFSDTEQLREWGFYWKEGDPATASDTKVDAKGEPKVTIEGLKPFTLYYILAYAIDKNGLELSVTDKFLSGYAAPQLTKPVLSDITVSGASASFEITYIGGSTIAECSIQYSADGNTWTKKPVTYAEGAISYSLTGLNPAAKYFVQAYARNSGGKEAYSETAEFTTAGSVPALAKPTATALASYKVNMVGGKVTDEGRLAVTEYGFCWSTEKGKAETTGSNYVKITAAGKDAFEYLSYDLLAGTKYYVRAYAKNAAGTSYSEEVTVTTPAVVYGSVQDWWYNGTTYKTVQIGNQTWMAEDLRNRGDGSRIFTRKYMNDHYASMCPTDWHVPSQAEWNDLITETGGKNIAPKVLRVADAIFPDGTNSSGLGVTTQIIKYNQSYFYTATHEIGQNLYVAFFYENTVTTSVCADWAIPVRCIKNQ